MLTIKHTYTEIGGYMESVRIYLEVKGKCCAIEEINDRNRPISQPRSPNYRGVKSYRSPGCHLRQL